MGSPRGPGSPRLCQMYPWQESNAILDHRAARPILTCHCLHQTSSPTSLRKLNTGHHGRGGSHSDSLEPHGHPRDLSARPSLSARAPLDELAVLIAIQDTIKTSRWLLTFVTGDRRSLSLPGRKDPSTRVTPCAAHLLRLNLGGCCRRKRAAPTAPHCAVPPPRTRAASHAAHAHAPHPTAAPRRVSWVRRRGAGPRCLSRSPRRLRSSSVLCRSSVVALLGAPSRRGAEPQTRRASPRRARAAPRHAAALPRRRAAAPPRRRAATPSRAEPSRAEPPPRRRRTAVPRGLLSRGVPPYCALASRRPDATSATFAARRGPTRRRGAWRAGLALAW